VTGLPPPSASPEIELPLGEYISGAQERVNHSIEGYLEGIGPDYRPMFAHALGGENPKRLRPVLALMTSDTLGVPREHTDDFAVSVELIHSASLVMDDLPGQDNSDLRRGQESLHRRFGVGPAELAIVAMLSEANKIAIGVDAKHNLAGRLSSSLAEDVGPRGMSLGQLLDLRTTGQAGEDVAERELDKISWLKTGRAIEMSTVGAALIANPPEIEDIVNIMTRFSYHTGIAYQVRDDLRDGTKTTEETGKPAGIDAHNEKPTYLSQLGEAVTREKASRHAAAALDVLNDLPERYNPVKFREIVAYLTRK
jgi:geranylgeranyl pyrophosphate synthase